MAVKSYKASQIDLQRLQTERAILLDDMRQLVDELRDQVSTLSALLADAKWIAALQDGERSCQRFKM